MALQASGAISVADINTELTLPATTTSSLNDGALRALAGIGSGAIQFSDFYGHSMSGGGSGGAVTVGSLYMFGAGGSGDMGLGNWNNVLVPTQVGLLPEWKTISLGYDHNLAIKNDGTLWAWGANDVGQLGLGHKTSMNSPVQVGTASDWASVECRAGSHSFAIKTNGTLWACGSNSGGQLGLNSTVDKSVLTQVGTQTTWKQIAGGETFVAALKTNGTLWTWGDNYAGQLANGTLVPRSSPVQVGSLTNWSILSCHGLHGAAIKTNGTLWEWGDVAGQGSILSSPVQTGSATWSSISSGFSYLLAIKTDGTMWIKGVDQMWSTSGNPHIQATLAQVGTSTWAKVSAGNIHALATKSDGTVWAWGFGESGELGLGDALSKSVPTQIGSSTWATAVAGGMHSALIA